MTTYNDPILDALQAQLDAVMWGTWVQKYPKNEGEACAEYRHENGVCVFLVTKVAMYAWRALKQLHPEQFGRWSNNLSGALVAYNDHDATREDIIAILEEAMVLRKEDL